MANPRNMRVQVDRLALIAAIERKQRQCQKEYERSGEKHLKAVEKWKREEVARIRAEAKRLNERAAKLSKTPAETIIKDQQDRVAKGWSPRYYDQDGHSFNPPHEREGSQLVGFDNVLRMLRMSKKDSVSLSEEQFKAYMDGCPVR